MPPVRASKFDDPRRKALGQRVRSAREAAGLTQGEVAQPYGYTHTWLSQIEAGRNGVDALDLQDIAALLGYSIAYFTDPKFGGSFVKPRTKHDWLAMYADEPSIGEALFAVEQAIRRQLASAEHENARPR